MADVKLLGYSVSEMSFVNIIQKTETFELTNRCAYNLGFPQDDVHRTTYKLLFPHIKAIITSLTVAANVPPIFFPDINIDGQSVYMMENPKKI